MDRSTFALLLVPPYRSTFEIFTSVLKAPVPTFFDVTSVDRMLLVRLGRKIDSTLLHYILYLVEFHFALFAVLFVCAQAKRSYNATTNELYRMDGVTRSPLKALVGETYQSRSTVHAFAISEVFPQKQHQAVDNHMLFHLHTAFAARWFHMVRDLLGIHEMVTYMGSSCWLHVTSSCTDPGDLTAT
ncbi:hypothetical protein H257_11057 [Aphanomyces astaci]|uniref:Uncharacterized protein n=1 Tax=Aphanomyces astaci TaxID=112090 RepID=W4G665_APHAT|nr:hypothetical protein H257_11057 [Aphanomyces astaci]ETV74539.1 hypothetical protein H257_11057 [Aphanomyces astaci]|eukprot:XP_009836197.1 hypothetical protein H257_11057 [Aphanomyces astaci]